VGCDDCCGLQFAIVGVLSIFVFDQSDGSNNFTKYRATP
jgi:hypothetical protein